MQKDYSDTTVIVPTMNEAGNIGKLIRMLCSSYPNISVIVSDDGSSDGTRAEVAALSKDNRRISFLDRSRKPTHGLTESVVDAALAVKTAKIVVMDADLQHPVAKVGEISRKLSRFDMVVGVRTRIRDWSASRRILSKGMTTLAYLVFKLRGRKTCSDMMSGLFGIRAEMLKRMIKSNRDGFVGRGYKVMLDTLRLIGSDASIAEVYYSTFSKRAQGQSKMGGRQIALALVSTFK